MRSLQIAVAVELFESVYFDHFYTICSSDWEDARKCCVKAAVFRWDQQNRESSSQYSIQAHNTFTQRSDLHDTHVYRSKYWQEPQDRCETVDAMSTVMRIGLELGFKMYYNFSRPPKGPFSPHHNIIITPLTWNSEQHQQALTCQPCRLTGVCKPVFQTQLLDHTSPGSPARWAAKRRSASLADNNRKTSVNEREMPNLM